MWRSCASYGWCLWCILFLWYKNLELSLKFVLDQGFQNPLGFFSGKFSITSRGIDTIGQILWEKRKMFPKHLISLKFNLLIWPRVLNSCGVHHLMILHNYFTNGHDRKQTNKQTKLQKWKSFFAIPWRELTYSLTTLWGSSMSGLLQIQIKKKWLWLDRKRGEKISTLQ